jgi:hypothetical protein
MSFSAAILTRYAPSPFTAVSAWMQCMVGDLLVSSRCEKNILADQQIGSIKVLVYALLASSQE